MERPKKTASSSATTVDCQCCQPHKQESQDELALSPVFQDRDAAPHHKRVERLPLLFQPEPIGGQGFYGFGHFPFTACRALS